MRQPLVLGGTGFVGMNLLDALLARGIRPRTTFRKRSITAFAQKRDVEWVPGDLEDPASLEAAMRGCDVVFFTAGHYPRYSLEWAPTIERGVADVRHVCEAARRAGVQRVVYTSSIGALGEGPGARVDEHVRPSEPPDSLYRATKWAMEREVDRATASGLDVVTLLPGACLGPWDARLGTSGVLVALLRGALPWWVDGTVNVVDVRDVALAHVEAATRAPTGARYVVGGRSLSLRLLFTTICARFGGALPPLELDAASARSRAEAEERAAAPRKARVPMPRELVDLITWGQAVDSSRARRELGLVFRPLEQTLDDAHAWFVRFGFLPSRTDLDSPSHQEPA
ncbi:MAG: NAD-dependent epimerase/dehydratase family protein [Myxococcales bacterium]|nr:NAD-dependent epimerase/dehydratase family protein [Myxococcales bacterium]